MSNVLHHAQPTATQFGASGQRARFLAKINERADAMKPKPVVIPIITAESEPAQPVPVQVKVTSAELAERIKRVAEDLKDLRRLNASIMRQEHAEINGYPAIKDIQRAVCMFYGITMLDMQSRRRFGSIVLPRQIGMYLAKTITLQSLPQVARKFGNRDHTTVLHAVRKIGELVLSDMKLAEEIAAIKSTLVPLRIACSEPIEGTPCNSVQTTT